MKKCPFCDIVPKNLSLDVQRKIAQRYNVKECPYAQAYLACECGHEIYMTSQNRVKKTYTRCNVCATYLDITKAKIVCIATDIDEECMLAKEEEKD